jgi:hypothetical protein
MKYAVRRRGLSPADIKRVAERNNNILVAVLCLANESCAIGDCCFVSLKNHLVRSFRKYAATYGALVNLETGEVIVRSLLNRCYANRLSDEVASLKIKQEILAQLGRRLWWYLEETNVTLWIAGLDEQLRAEAKRQAIRAARRQMREQCELRRAIKAALRLARAKKRTRSRLTHQKVDF